MLNESVWWMNSMNCNYITQMNHIIRQMNHKRSSDEQHASDEHNVIQNDEQHEISKFLTSAFGWCGDFSTSFWDGFSWCQTMDDIRNMIMWFRCFITALSVHTIDHTASVAWQDISAVWTNKKGSNNRKSHQLTGVIGFQTDFSLTENSDSIT